MALAFFLLHQMNQSCRVVLKQKPERQEAPLFAKFVSSWRMREQDWRACEEVVGGHGAESEIES